MIFRRKKHEILWSFHGKDYFSMDNIKIYIYHKYLEIINDIKNTLLCWQEKKSPKGKTRKTGEEFYSSKVK